MKSLDFVLVKPVGPDCNLSCKYCFYLEKADLFHKTKTHLMSDSVLEELMKQSLLQSGEQLSITWQGGEPTLAGLDFYERAISYQYQYGEGKIVINGFQTNGMNIDNQWARFLGRNNFLVGLSLDGTKHLHDKYRKTQGGKPSWNRVMRSLDLLHSNKVEVNAMCCVTDYSAEYVEELYEFYKSIGLNWMQFIPVVELDKNNPNKTASFSLTAKKYGDFLVRLFELWIGDFDKGNPTTHIREFDSLFYTYAGLKAPECSLLPKCGVYPVVEHNGNVYSCDFFVEKKWKLGNIKYNKLIEMLNSKKQERFGAMKKALPQKCNVCKWYEHCFGGCIKDRVKDPEDGGMPRFCSSTISLLEYADSQFNELAEKWKKANSHINNTLDLSGAF